MNDHSHADSPVMKFSSAELPERDRPTILRELIGRGIWNAELTPLSAQVAFEAELRQMPGLSVIWGENSPHRFQMNRDSSRGSDDLVIGIFARPLRVSALGRQLDLDGGEATTMAADMVSISESPWACEHTTLKIPRTALMYRVRNPEDAFMRRLPAGGEALTLLRGYLGWLRGADATLSAPVEHAVVAHLHDLVALALGPTREGAALAAERGVRAARLQGMKRYILAHLGDSDLSVRSVAARQGVTPRYVQALFEGDGTTFSAYVLHERLARAMRQLSDPAARGQSIAAIAFHAGFNNLSYFNRMFRRAFGRAPSDVRE